MNRDEKLELIYESMFLLEGKKETEAILRNKGIDDVIINKLIEMDTTPSKKHAIKLGAFYKQGVGLEKIKDYYKKFIKQNTKNKNIDQFITFIDLANFIDGLESTRGKIDIEGKKTSEDIQKERIYFDDNVDIYLAKNQKDACRYGHELGQSYSFCISRKYGSNMYTAYRLRQQSNFYFILFKKKSNKIIDGKFEDASHIIVLDVLPNNKLQWTWADNDPQGTGTRPTTWEEVLTHAPELEVPFNKGIFKENRLTPQEKEKIQKYTRISDYGEMNEFLNLSYDDKKEYIASGLKIDLNTFKQLDSTLRNEYIGQGHELDETFYTALTDKEKVRWGAVRLTVLNQMFDEGLI